MLTLNEALDYEDILIEDSPIDESALTELYQLYEATSSATSSGKGTGVGPDYFKYINGALELPGKLAKGFLTRSWQGSKLGTKVRRLKRSFSKSGTRDRDYLDRQNAIKKQKMKQNKDRADELYKDMRKDKTYKNVSDKELRQYANDMAGYKSKADLDAEKSAKFDRWHASKARTQNAKANATGRRTSLHNGISLETSSNNNEKRRTTLKNQHQNTNSKDNTKSTATQQSNKPATSQTMSDESRTTKDDESSTQ